MINISDENDGTELALALAQIKEAEAAETIYKLRREALAENNSPTLVSPSDYSEYLKRIRGVVSEEEKENLGNL